MIIADKDCLSFALAFYEKLEPEASSQRPPICIEPKNNWVADFLTALSQQPSDSVYIVPSIKVLLSGIVINVEKGFPIRIITSEKLAKDEVTQLINRFSNGPREVTIIGVSSFLGGRP